VDLGNQRLVSDETKKELKVGDKVRVRIVTLNIKIKSEKELFSLLERAYFYEEMLENDLDWDAFLFMGEKFRDVVFKLAHDSAGHKENIQGLADNLEGMVIGDLKEKINVPQYNFQDLEDEEIVSKLYDLEVLMEDFYTNLYKHTSRKLIRDIWLGDNSEEFFQNIKFLIAQERTHQKLLEPYVKTIQRI